MKTFNASGAGIKRKTKGKNINSANDKQNVKIDPRGQGHISTELLACTGVKFPLFIVVVVYCDDCAYPDVDSEEVK